MAILFKNGESTLVDIKADSLNRIGKINKHKSYNNNLRFNPVADIAFTNLNGTAQLIVVEGTLYPLLTRLKNAELLAYRWEESKSGPPRKYYSLTKEGASFLKELDTTWNELVNAVNVTTSNS